ncbi:Mini-ribonuclease 3 [Eubacterium oxidoreducens]|uniref:Mini-ribonuclease 3 n=1 Tax=Eubacterium oxidoreducens TaxID=1732 RepID=A0A1G6BCS2_EUBOX|nr:ribonuclease III domain-containing protein [Eubacterium oxidoreducens]SDB18405.1 ribonuclease-3 family protein [Eubacterium oxidoreducens]
MEQGLNEFIRKQFALEKQDIRSYSPLTLAFIGDGVFDLIVRTVIVGEGNTKPSMLHGHSAHFVKATAQSKMMECLETLLTEEEESYYRRGRNAKSKTTAKNASVIDYRRATGLETLMGYLYLTGQLERAIELTRKGLEYYGK